MKLSYLGTVWAQPNYYVMVPGKTGLETAVGICGMRVVCPLNETRNSQECGLVTVIYRGGKGAARRQQKQWI